MVLVVGELVDEFSQRCQLLLIDQIELQDEEHKMLEAGVEVLRIGEERGAEGSRGEQKRGEESRREGRIGVSHSAI